MPSDQLSIHELDATWFLPLHLCCGPLPRIGVVPLDTTNMSIHQEFPDIGINGTAGRRSELVAYRIDNVLGCCGRLRTARSAQHECRRARGPGTAGRGARYSADPSGTMRT